MNVDRRSPTEHDRADATEIRELVASVLRWLIVLLVSLLNT